MTRTVGSLTKTEIATYHGGEPNPCQSDSSPRMSRVPLPRPHGTSKVIAPKSGAKGKELTETDSRKSQNGKPVRLTVRLQTEENADKPSSS